MRTTVFFLFSFFISIQLAHSVPKITAPLHNAPVSGREFNIEIAGCKTLPDRVLVAGREMEQDWKPLPYKRQWIMKVKSGKLPVGFHEIELQGGCFRRLFSKKKISVFKTDLSPLEMGVRLAESYMRGHNPYLMTWNWEEAVFLYGLFRLATRVEFGKLKYVNFIRRYHKFHIGKGLPRINWADRCPSALTALLLARDENEWRAYEGAVKVAEYIRDARRNSLGALNHLGMETPSSKFYPASIWVDSLMMVNLFAVLWGDFNKDKDLFEFGIAQPWIYASVLQDYKTGLFRHAWNMSKGIPIPKTPDFWLRGNGWVVTSIMDMLDVTPVEHPMRSRLIQIVKRVLKGIAKYQLSNGLWDSIANDPGYSYPETSGSALVAYAMAKAVNKGLINPHYREIAMKTWRGVLSRLRVGREGLVMTGISGGTIPTGKTGYRLVPLRDNKPFGLGAFFLLAAELSR